MKVLRECFFLVLEQEDSQKDVDTMIKGFWNNRWKREALNWSIGKRQISHSKRIEGIQSPQDVFAKRG